MHGINHLERPPQMNGNHCCRHTWSLAFEFGIYLLEKIRRSEDFDPVTAATHAMKDLLSWQVQTEPDIFGSLQMLEEITGRGLADIVRLPLQKVRLENLAVSEG